ncbi:MAG: TetR/AcrR family transcriptional regulator [Salinivirgaceae bacterium]|nr:TetR/AcrR family transcriptional regulator [Salinivirgaceae bacterium]
MPRTKEQFEEIRLEKAKMIKQVALELFANNGYYQTSISEIAKAANISKGLIYNYFESKDELLRDIINSMINEIYASFDRNHDGELTGDEFEFFVREAFRLQKEKREFYKMYYVLLMQPNIQEIINHASGELMQNVMAITYQYFKKHFQDPETEMLLYSSLVKGLSMQYVFAPENFSDEIFEKAINRIIEFHKR